MQPEEQAGFEAYVQQYIRDGEASGTTPDGFGETEFGTGVIWSLNYSIRETYRDIGPLKESTAEYNFLLPVMTPLLPVIFMLNIYSISANTKSVNKAYKRCINGEKAEAVTSPFVELYVSEGIPGTAYYYPISPFQNRSHCAGFIQLLHNWEDTIIRVIPSLEADLQVVLTGTFEDDNGGSTSESITFEIADSDIKAFTPRIREPSSDALSARKIHYPPLTGEENCAGCDVYSLTFYPTTRGYEKYHNNNPLMGAIVVSLVVLLIGLLFSLYNLGVERESSRQAALLESKRMFVRFISHEIRTPLNSAVLGLELLGDGLQQAQDAPESVKRDRYSEWSDLISEVKESSTAAVEVLDDLINYDKVRLLIRYTESYVYCNSST